MLAGCHGAPSVSRTDSDPPLRSAPAVGSYRDGHLEVFVEGSTRTIWRSICADAPCESERSFGDWVRDVGEPPVGVGSAPTAASWGGDRIDVFVLGRDDLAIWHQTWLGSRWLGWESMGGWLASAPAAVSFANGRLDVFATDANGSIWHTWCAALGVPGCRGSGFSTWEQVPGSPPPGALGPPVVASGDHNSLELVVLGKDHAIWHHSYDNNWGSWRSLGGSFVSTPALAARGGHNIDVFGVDAAGRLSRTTARRGNAREWKEAAQRVSPQIAAAPSGGGTQLFARQADGSALIQYSCDPGGQCNPVRQ
jgi:hypothetical protein